MTNSQSNGGFNLFMKLCLLRKAAAPGRFVHSSARNEGRGEGGSCGVCAPPPCRPAGAAVYLFATFTASSTDHAPRPVESTYAVILLLHYYIQE